MVLGSIVVGTAAVPRAVDCPPARRRRTPALPMLPATRPLPSPSKNCRRPGIRDPEVAVPLATTTGWNFRSEAIGNPGDIYQLLGSYTPLSTTKARREAARDPRLSIEKRYHGIDDYLQRVRAAAMELIRSRYMLQEDLDPVLARAREHWTFALGSDTSSTGGGR
jgi:hypothetical protein